MNTKNSELESLSLAGNINIWSENQSTLEEQALKELETFAKELNGNEEGEIIDDNNEEDEKDDKNFSLNVESYIKRQQDLKKRQDFQRSLANDTNKSNNSSKKRKIRDDSDLEDKSGSEYVPSDYEDSDSSIKHVDQQAVKIKKNTRKKSQECADIEKVVDDGDYKTYKARLDLYYKLLEQEEESLKQLYDSYDSKDVHTIQDNLKIPLKIWTKLYNYQQDGVKWMWNIHRKSTGGLLGDEMGLGKTVQVIVFLHSLQYSQISSCHGRFIGLGPTLIVCPATVIHQWVQHFHEWAPEFRVAVLHQSGSYKGDKNRLIKEMRKTKGVIITTYQGVIKYQTYLFDYEWHYVILDEGHKIRNPATKATGVVKSLNTPHRLMLTGSPMQNDLTELWSLFDFTNPGMLGNLKTFQEHFIEPILQGGYANSTYVQEATALSVASALKDQIEPYLLRRTKHQVQGHISLPNKTEQVLFCSLSDEQKALYKDYLLGENVADILGKGVKNWSGDNGVRAKVFVAITKLRKICNHPDIYLSDEGEGELRFDYKSSGKMVVVSALLKIWKKQGHRVLLFTQGRSMMEVFRRFLDQQGYKYLKMDGTTSISTRQPLIEKFNKDSNYDVFLLTTRVGGLGVNLTGANRVIIYDPDWNPATDTQARERAWRIGQDKEVTIYRLLTAGTIEEKMYQRQVWKQLLSNKILLDPRTNKFFKSSDLFDLFSLQENSDNAPETVNIFHKSRVRIQNKLKKSKKPPKSNPSEASEQRFSDEKLLQMKHMAQRIAKSLSKQPESANRLEIEEEKRRRREEMEELKRLDVTELRKYNVEKARASEDIHVNKIDDREALVGFPEALEYTETTARLHRELKTSKDLSTIADKVKTAKETVSKEPEKLIKKFKKRKIDSTGKIDGEKIKGLVKTETKKTKNKNASNKSSNQDDFILGKLFHKKGVSGAIQHDSVVQETSKGGSLRVHTEARMRAEKSLQALKKSRLDNWKW